MQTQQTLGQPLAQPMGQPLAQPYGSPFGQPTVQPLSQPIMMSPMAGPQIITVREENFTCYRVLLIICIIGAVYGVYDNLIAGAITFQSIIYVLLNILQLLVFGRALQNLQLRDLELQKKIVTWLKLIYIISFIVITIIVMIVPVMVGLGCNNACPANGLIALIILYLFVWIIALFVGCIIPFFTWRAGTRYLACLEASQSAIPVQITYQ